MTQNQILPGSTEYKSNRLNVVVNRLPGSQVRLEITVFPEELEDAYKQAVKSINKEISLPGFRKGKAPDEVVIKKYEKPIHNQWRDIVLQTGFKEALRLANLQPFNSETIRCIEFKDTPRTEPTKLILQFEARPEVPEMDLQDISLPQLEAVPIKQKDVEQVVKNLRLYHSKWEDVTGRPVQEGDYVDLDIENLDEETTICKDTRFEVKKGSMANWMLQLLVGANLNDTVEGTSEKDENLPKDSDEEEPPEFRPTRCRMVIKTIKHPVLPELNEEFAKKAGTKDIAELEERVKADLKRRADEKRQQQLTRALDEALLNKYQFEVPASLVQAEIAQRLANQRDWMMSQNAKQEEIQSVLEDLEQRLPSEVEKGCRLLFLLLSFANQHNIEVSPEEIISELSQQIAYGQIPQDIKDPNLVRDRISQSLLLRKTKNYIVNQVLDKRNG